jgi:hypothetical protein
MGRRFDRVFSQILTVALGLSCNIRLSANIFLKRCILISFLPSLKALKSVHTFLYIFLSIANPLS